MRRPGKIPLANPEVGRREKRIAAKVLRTGRLSLGPMVDDFERGFAEWLGVDDAVAVSSGTAALHLGVRRLGWGDRNEVLTTPFTFVASANCLLYEGAKPVFCDIDPSTLNIDPAAVDAAVGERSVGILPVHIFGYPAAMPELEAVAAQHGLGILEDACQALGATDSEGRKVGARGNLAAFAFYANKQLTTGEGGMIVPRDEKEAARLRSERNQGRAADMDWLDHERLGFNYRMPELSAALGVAQIAALSGTLERRAGVARLYERGLSGVEGVEIPMAARRAERRGWFVYPVQLAEGIDRDATIERLKLEGIESKAYLPCIHKLRHLREPGTGDGTGEFPVAEAASARSLALPFFPAMTESQVGRVCEALAEALR